MQPQMVFIIDDDAAVRQSVAALVRGQGDDVQTFPTVREFLDRDIGSVSGCVVTELGLPDMSGFELLAELKAKEVLLPVVVLTAKDLQQEEMQLLEAQVQKVILKGPQDVKELLDFVRSSVTLRP